MFDREKFVSDIAAFTGYIAKVLPDDVLKRLQEMKAVETLPMASAIYTCMFENLEKAAALNRPLCQDTGVIQFYVRAGTAFPYLNELESAFTDAVLLASRETPLRPNAVEPFVEKNTGTNVGTKAPWIEFELVPNADTVEMDIYMAGGGCSLPGRSQVFMPSAGYEGIEAFVMDIITTLGINACPPLIVGVGIGACVSSAAKLSKKAALRAVGSHNPNPLAAAFEEKLETSLNAIGIGPQGLSGTESVMGVNVEYAARHPSTLAAAVSVGCWAHRRGTIRFNRDLSYEILSHRGAVL